MIIVLALIVAIVLFALAIGAYWMYLAWLLHELKEESRRYVEESGWLPKK